MSFWKILGFSPQQPPRGAGGTETVRRIVNELESLPPEKARFIAAFAFILGRVAHADRHISAEETREMERIVRRIGHMDEDEAILVVQIAKTQNRMLGGTENFLVTREFNQISDPEQRRELLECLFAVSVADEVISAEEDAQLRQIASELGFSHKEFVSARSAYSAHREVLRPFHGQE